MVSRVFFLTLLSAVALCCSATTCEVTRGLSQEHGGFIYLTWSSNAELESAKAKALYEAQMEVVDVVRGEGCEEKALVDALIAGLKVWKFQKTGGSLVLQGVPRALQLVVVERLTSVLGKNVSIQAPEATAAAVAEPAAAIIPDVAAVVKVPAAVPEAPAAVPEAPAAVPEAPAAVPEAPAAVPEAPAAVPEAPAAIISGSTSSISQPRNSPKSAGSQTVGGLLRGAEACPQTKVLIEQGLVTFPLKWAADATTDQRKALGEEVVEAVRAQIARHEDCKNQTIMKPLLEGVHFKAVGSQQFFVGVPKKFAEATRKSLLDIYHPSVLAAVGLPKLPVV